MLSTSKPSVLVAEDHPVNQKIASLLLTSLGVETRMAEDGGSAVELYQKERPDLILMDIMMPGMDGFQASRQIRALEFGKKMHTPIIACTALDVDKIKEMAISCGMDDYLGKPYTRDMLIAMIEGWLNFQLKPLPNQSEESFIASVSSKHAIDRTHLAMLYGLEQLDDILSLFLTVTEALLAQLDSAVQAQDISEVRRIAHEIKSGSAAVDAKELAQLCLKLEEIGDDWPEVVKTYPALALAFAKVREFLEKKQEEGPAGVGLPTRMATDRTPALDDVVEP